MAGVVRAHGNAAAAEFIGKDIHMINVDRGSSTFSQAEFDAAVLAIETTATVVTLGAFAAATQQSFNAIIEGMDDAAGAGAGGYRDAYALSTKTWLEQLAAITGHTVTKVAF